MIIYYLHILEGEKAYLCWPDYQKLAASHSDFLDTRIFLYALACLSEPMSIFKNL